jgi:hypothetical protein
LEPEAPIVPRLTMSPPHGGFFSFSLFLFLSLDR